MFGAGCFWGVQAAFDELPIEGSEVGYAGGKDSEKVTYEDVCSGKTGHAEVVRVKFDPEKIDYTELLDLFWSIHNPTTLNRQGPDVGEQYRSVIFYYNRIQKELAEASLSKEQEKKDEKIVTEIVEASDFYRAEEYHQKYAEKHGGAACHI